MATQPNLTLMTNDDNSYNACVWLAVLQSSKASMNAHVNTVMLICNKCDVVWQLRKSMWDSDQFYLSTILGRQLHMLGSVWYVRSSSEMSIPIHQYLFGETLLWRHVQSGPLNIHPPSPTLYSDWHRHYAEPKLLVLPGIESCPRSVLVSSGPHPLDGMCLYVGFRARVTHKYLQSVILHCDTETCQHSPLVIPKKQETKHFKKN